MRPTLNPALRDFWTTPARYRVLHGGRASGKSWDAAGVAIARAQYVPTRFLCTRQIQNKIDQSVYALLKLQIKRFGLESEFRVLDNKILCPATGSEFMFYGLWRHTSEIKSLEGVDVHWSEEAHGLTPEQWKIIDPTLRGDDSEHWLIFNPDLVTDFAYQNFVVNPPPRAVVRQINYTENQWLSQNLLSVIEHMRVTDPDEHAHVYLGGPRAESATSLIPRAWVNAAIDAHLALGFEPTGARRMALDVADEGTDLNAQAGRTGVVLDYLTSWSGKGSDIYDTTERAIGAALAERYDSLRYDADGLGAGVKGDARKVLAARPGADLEVSPFRGSGAVVNPDGKIDPDGDKKERTNKDFFANAKAQAWWDLRERFRRTFRAVVLGQPVDDPDGLISISSRVPQLDALKLELSQPTYGENGAGKIVINKQPDNTKSPNLADAVMIAYAPNETKRRGFLT